MQVHEGKPIFYTSRKVPSSGKASGVASVKSSYDQKYDDNLDFSGISPYKISKDVPSRKKLSQLRVSNMRRDKDTFFLEKSLEKRIEDSVYGIRAKSETRKRPSSTCAFQIKRNKEYLEEDQKLNASAMHTLLSNETQNLNDDNLNLNAQTKIMRKGLRQLKLDQIKIRNKAQAVQLVPKDPYRIEQDALRVSEQNFATRRKTEHFGHLIKKENSHIEVVKSEVEKLKEALEYETTLKSQLEKDNEEAYRRILEKQKRKKELEQRLATQQSQMNTLTLKVSQLQRVEDYHKETISKFVQETNLIARQNFHSVLRSSRTSRTDQSSKKSENFSPAPKTKIIGEAIGEMIGEESKEDSSQSKEQIRGGREEDLIYKRVNKAMEQQIDKQIEEQKSEGGKSQSTLYEEF